jgi:mannose-6-phosphate isomerase-like protein (cupin superfamily)
MKVMLAPDTRDVPEVTYSHVIINSGSKADYHKHDRPELIQILSGRGISVCEGREITIEPDMALWVRAGEMHQIINTGVESIKLATVFVPGYTARENLERCVWAAEGTSEERDQP